MKDPFTVSHLVYIDFMEKHSGCSSYPTYPEFLDEILEPVVRDMFLSSHPAYQKEGKPLGLYVFEKVLLLTEELNMISLLETGVEIHEIPPLNV